MTRKFAQLIGVWFLALGSFMLLMPMNWYQITPGVVETGPFNMHFVMDIGLVFIACGALFVFGAIKGNAALMLSAAIWPAMHALFHIYIWFSRDMALDAIAFSNLVGIQLPGWAALFLALSAQKEA
jgi:hypothetical protein